MKLWPPSFGGFGGANIMSELKLDTIDTTDTSEMWARASGSDTPANDVPTGSSHMPAPATEHNLNNNHNFNSHDAVPRIYLSSRVAEDHTATVGTSPAPTPSAKMDILNQAYATLTSKTAQRTLLNTVLLTAFSTVLYGFAALVYVASYNAYLPDQITTLPLHLQYNYGPNPYAVSALPNIKPYQAYDVSLTLTLPRSPANVDRDNFMVALYLLDKPGTAVPISSSSSCPDEQQKLAPNQQCSSILSNPDPTSYLANRRILHASHRPALVPYTDPLVSLADRLLFLPRYIFLSPSSASSTTLSLPLAEKLSFPTKTSPATPTSLFIELQAGQSLRVASASVTVTAQLSGLRWLMYHHWLSSFLAGTALFWGCEVVAMGVAWVVLSSVLFGSDKDKQQPGRITDGKKIGREEEEPQMSDTERTFPTSSKAPPLKYESQGERGGVKEEDLAGLDMAELPVAKGEAADDEDDEAGGGWRDRDSGIGTSYSDAAGVGKGAGGVRRRTSGKGR